jgi:hypothetical protein
MSRRVIRDAAILFFGTLAVGIVAYILFEMLA